MNINTHAQKSYSQLMEDVDSDIGRVKKYIANFIRKNPMRSRYSYKELNNFPCMRWLINKCNEMYINEWKEVWHDKS